MSDDEKKPAVRGRPVTNTMPEPIPDTPENIARALLTTTPKKREEWDYLKQKEDKQKTTKVDYCRYDH